MSAPGRRLLVLCVLALWVGPMAGAVGIGLHLALDDHHRHDHHGHDAADGVLAAELSELVGTAAEEHHHHDLDAATDHGHEAALQRTSPVRRQSSSLMPALGSSALRGSLVAVEAAPKPPPRVELSDPLFKTHCTLLL